jgi:hypothetical protein
MRKAVANELVSFNLARKLENGTGPCAFPLYNQLFMKGGTRRPCVSILAGGGTCGWTCFGIAASMKTFA